MAWRSANVEGAGRAYEWELELKACARTVGVSKALRELTEGERRETKKRKGGGLLVLPLDQSKAKQPPTGRVIRANFRRGSAARFPAQRGGATAWGLVHLPRCDLQSEAPDPCCDLGA
jgi:hypothetical protein